MTAYKRTPIKGFKQFLNARTPSPKTIAKHYDTSTKNVNAAIKTGSKIEREHTKSPAAAREIAADHLGELGLRYYPELDKMESKLKKFKLKKKEKR